MSRDELWDDMQRALDARCDPFEDPALARRLASHGEVGPAVDLLLERLELLRSSAPARVPRRVVAALACAAALLAALALGRLGPRAPEPAGRVWSAAITVERVAPQPPTELTRIEHRPRDVYGWTIADAR